MRGPGTGSTLGVVSTSNPPVPQGRPSAEDTLRLTQLNTLLGDRYRVETMLGRGGAGRVYRVRNLRLGRLEALKVLTDSGEEAASFSRRFTQEAQLAASLRHPNIITVYDYGDTEGMLWFSMELVEGQSLASVLSSSGQLSEVDTVAVALPILDALAYIHERGIVHRDVKPSNVMLDRTGAPKLMDFGVAKAPESSTRTTTGAVLGSPAYLAPEQFAGLPVDGRTDVYSLGVTLYELLTGALPFGIGSPLQVMVTRLSGEPEAITVRRPDLDPELAEIVTRAFARDPDDRFASAGEMRARLEAWWSRQPRSATLGHLAASGRPPAGAVAQLPQSVSARPRPRWPARRLAVLSAIGAVVLGVVVLGLARWPSSPVPETLPTPVPTATAVAAAVTPALATPSITATSAPMAGAAGEAERSEPRPTAARPAPVPRRPVTMPEEIARVAPVVPPELLERCTGQQVMLALLVGEDGLVRRASVLRAADSECGRLAVEAASQAAYRPARDSAGDPVEAQISIAVTLGELPSTAGEGPS